MKAHYIIRNAALNGERMKESDSYQYALEYIRANLEHAVIENSTTGRYQNVDVARSSWPIIIKSAWYTPVPPYEN